MPKSIDADLLDSIELEFILIPDKNFFWMIRRKDNKAELLWGNGNLIRGGLVKTEFSKYASHIDLLALTYVIKKFMK